MLDNAFYTTIWQVYTATGIRPEWIVPVLYAESGLNPGVINSIGCAGLNQLCAGWLQTIGMTAEQYAALPASEQLTTGVIPYMTDAVSRYGRLRSGTRVYQANYLPATLSTARSLTSVIASAPSAYYAQNKGFDTQNKGYITLQDLANSVARAVSTPTVRAVLDQVYSGPYISAGIFGGPGPEEDPVYGEDFGAGAELAGIPWQTIGVTAAILAGSAGIAWAIMNPRTVRKVRRVLARTF